MQRSLDSVLKPRDLQQRRTSMLYRPLDQSVRLHCQRVSVEFNIRCSFSVNLGTRVFQALKCSTPIRDQAELIRLFGIWSTARLSFVPYNGGAIIAVSDCIVELTLHSVIYANSPCMDYLKDGETYPTRGYSSTDGAAQPLQVVANMWIAGEWKPYRLSCIA